MSMYVTQPLQGSWYSKTRQLAAQLTQLRNELYVNRDWDAIDYFLSRVSDPVIQRFFTDPRMEPLDLLNAMLFEKY
jgi:hypothetical protein